jgi:RNA polymerase sigma-70 factor (ECF subfamily)
LLSKEQRLVDDRRNLRNQLIVVRCQVGERAALDELVESWHVPLWRYVRRMVDQTEHANDCVQETWLRVLRGLPALRDPAKFTPWFFGIARRVLIDRLRTKYARPAESADIEGAALDAAEPAFDAEDMARLQEVLHRLPLVERESITLFYISGLSIDQVAEVAEVPAGTVKSRLHRARNMLRDAMESTGASP